MSYFLAHAEGSPVAKRKQGNPWEAAFERIRCVWYAGKAYQPKTLAAELDAVELELDFQFPLSYRAFAERFGLGGSLEVFPYHISVDLLPLTREPDAKSPHWGAVLDRSIGAREYYSRPENLPLLHRESRPEPSALCGQQHDVPAGARPTTQFGQLVAFAADDDEGLGTFLFQPSEVTDTRPREYRIYALNSARALRPVANSFWEWVAWVETNYRFPEDEDAERDAESTPPIAKPDPPGSVIQYKRAWIGDKKAPALREVKSWLAHSNVRDLALAIRDHGRTDAFPVLADALEEAGCANADVLDSCRRGDPDIDGVWVLRVLLGK